MKREYGSRHLLFKACIAAGFALGMVLLWQTVSTYVYVSGNMTLQAARSEAARKAASVAAAARASAASNASGVSDNARLTSILEDSLDDWKGQVAWLRIAGSGGATVATAGNVPADAAADYRPGPSQPELRQNGARPLMVAFAPILRAGPRPGTARSFSPPMEAEAALYVDSVSESFTSLRRNLIVGVSAALALMAALIVIGMRLPKYLRGQQVQGQLELAHRVQADLLPARDSVTADFDFSAECIPAWDVGGDFCDTFKVANDRTAFVLGDVSGKGISAALLMALIHGAIHSMSWTRSAQEHENASRSLNSLLCRKTATERFSSLFWGYFDPKTSVLRYINAGHLPPLLIREGEFGDLEIQRLEISGTILGLLPDAGFQQAQQFVRKGDLLVAFSDGIVEAPDCNGEEFGERGLIDAVRDGWKQSPGDIRNIVLQRLATFMDGEDVPDDQTLIVIRFKHAAALHHAAPRYFVRQAQNAV